ncbi:hypothetical protein SORBI_3010G011100 [Sorghum bicolor]|uniref:Uncharacterized protein n=1 Tax=Sorghum bicolor TaxID=4558 RepID=A0A194YGQ3_SORBI|nr:hypothetical protein SORBI_3010G011100 [Sorghum bicolor]
MIHRRSELCAAALYRETVLDSNESEMEQKKIRRGGLRPGSAGLGNDAGSRHAAFSFPGGPFDLEAGLQKPPSLWLWPWPPLQVELFGQKPPSSSDPLSLSLSQSVTDRQG